VTIVLDRAGITGPDGASHHGMWDMSICGVIPGLRLNAPRDGQSVARALREAVDVADGPTVIRFPKGSVAAPIEAVRSIGPLDVVADHTDGAEADMLIVAVGSMVATAITVAGKLAAEGQKVMVVDPRWVVPVAPELVDLARGVGRIAVIEDNVAVGGVGEQVVAALRADGNPATTSVFAIPREFLHHATRGQVLDQIGLTPDAIAAALAR
jgi:1-deoxy-D-xylulose-5-phosphate synthase